ncbi:MMPL family transporter [Nocardioides sp. SYSU DS0651]|uniref:MMPL family transporter n=1 Tax=Nocardioides sp. SYSU DS0651 TaxID=3415955 RepID=UPI003F4AF883
MITSPRWAWLVALGPLVAAVVAILALGEAERTPQPTDSLPDGADSTAGVVMQERLPESGESTTVVVYARTDGGTITDLLPRLERHATQLGAVPTGRGDDGADGAGAGEGGRGRPPVLMAAEDGTAAIAVVPVEGGSASAVADQVADLRDRVGQDLPDGVEALVTGPAGIRADLAEVFQGADVRLLAVTAAVVAVLLVVTYRSPVLWLVPLLVVGVADRLAAVLATQVLAGLGMAWDESTVGILSVLVFGAGTDYALLLISRYRDELKEQESRHAAMARAVRRTAHAVVASSATVVVGVLTLLLSLTPTTRGLGVACAAGIVVAAAFALVVLPAALVLFGRWIFWPRVPRTGQAALAEGGTVWHRLGHAVGRRPAAFAAGTVVVLAALASNVLAIDTGLDVDDQFLDEPEAIVGAQRIAESFPAGVASPTQVVTTDPAPEVLRAVEGVEQVSTARVAAEGQEVTGITVVLDAEPGSAEAAQAIGALRDAVAPYDAHVVGQEAEAIDETDAAARDRTVIFPVILLLVLVALGLLLRSVVAPVVLVVTVVATYAASMGASWWVFTGVFGFQALDSGAPLLAFLFLVALGVDYNIFLLSRAAEELPVHGNREGILRALAATGGVITSAGVLLAAVFLVLGVLPLVVLAQLGVIVCIGVLLDTLVVRTVLVPALAIRMGDRFWWPRSITPAGRPAPDPEPTRAG